MFSLLLQVDGARAWDAQALTVRPWCETPNVYATFFTKGSPTQFCKNACLTVGVKSALTGSLGGVSTPLLARGAVASVNNAVEPPQAECSFGLG